MRKTALVPAVAAIAALTAVPASSANASGGGTTLHLGPRFILRLVAERRIRNVKVGRHVRIPESALIEYVNAATVEPVVQETRWGRSA